MPNLMDDLIQRGTEAIRVSNVRDLFTCVEQGEAILPALEVAEQTVLSSKLELWRGVALYTSGEYASSYKHLHLALSLAQEVGDRVDQTKILQSLAQLEYATGDYANALETINRTLSLARETGDQEVISNSYCLLGNTYSTMGNLSGGLEEYRKALSIAEEHGLKMLVGGLYSNIGIILGEMNDDSALAMFERAIDIFNQTGNRSGLANTYGNIGSFYENVYKDLSKAEEWFRKGMELAHELELQREHAYYSNGLAGVLVRLERFEEAEKVVEEKESLARSQPEPRIGFLLTKARIEQHHGRPSEALSILTDAYALSSSFDLKQHALQALNGMRDVCEVLERWKEFVQHTREIESLMSGLDMEAHIRRASASEAEYKLADERRQSEAQRQLLYNTLPDLIADRLLNGEKLVADTYEDVSVLFLDVVEFTTISSKIPPGHLIHILNAVFSTCDDVIEQHGLTKVKTIGDSYMAVCGVPLPQDDHAVRTASAAIELLRSLQDLRVSIPEELGDRSWINDIPKLHVRIGLHSGSVVAGVVGTKRLQFDIWGDTVNVASRMETSGQPERIQVSDTFALAVTGNAPPEFEGTDVVLKRSPFLFRLRGTTEIKGKGEMKTFWLESYVDKST